MVLTEHRRAIRSGLVGEEWIALVIEDRLLDVEAHFGYLLIRHILP